MTRRPRPRTDSFWIIASPRVALVYTASDTRRGAWCAFHGADVVNPATTKLARHGFRAVRVTVELPEVRHG